MSVSDVKWTVRDNDSAPDPELSVKQILCEVILNEAFYVHLLVGFIS